MLSTVKSIQGNGTFTSPHGAPLGDGTTGFRRRKATDIYAKYRRALDATHNRPVRSLLASGVPSKSIEKLMLYQILIFNRKIFKRQGGELAPSATRTDLPSLLLGAFNEGGIQTHLTGKLLTDPAGLAVLKFHLIPLVVFFQQRPHIASFQTTQHLALRRGSGTHIQR